MWRKHGLMLGVALLCLSCAGRPVPTISESAFLPVTPTAASADNAMSRWIATYKAHVDSVMGIPIGTASAELAVGLPNAPLNSFITDAMLAFGKERYGKVDAALTNYGGIRANIPAGVITVGTIYQVMPFDNEVVLLTLSGQSMAALADAIARKGGELSSGIEMTIVGRGSTAHAEELRVGGEPLDTTRLYRIVTTDYLSFGNDQLEPLGQFTAMDNSRTELRTVLIDAVIQLDLEHKQVTPIKRADYHVKN